MTRHSLLCPNCQRLISRDEPYCPYCGLSRPGSSLKVLPLRWLTALSPQWLHIVIYANAVLYALSLLLNPAALGMSANPLTFLSPSDQSLFLLGATGTISINQFGRWWTILTASYLHGGILHIFFNMAALYQLGPFVLSEFGASRFLILYISSGIAGFALSYLAGVPFTIGASASICGLIGAILYYGKSRGGFLGDAIYRQALGWVIGLMIFGFIIPGINNWAHGGGIAAGILGGYILGHGGERNESLLDHAMAGILLIATIIALSWAIAQSIITLLA